MQKHAIFMACPILVRESKLFVGKRPENAMNQDTQETDLLERELIKAFREMSPEARNVMMEIARRYVTQFPAPRERWLRLVPDRKALL
jgi:hypothetical protein